jgi:hypothetical protein
MSLTQIAWSLVAVLALAVIARALRLGESRISDAATAREMAQEALVAFEARAAVVSTDGSAALVAGGGAIAVLKRHGAKVAVRRLVSPLQLSEAVEGVTIDTGERMFGRVTLFGVLADEVRKLEGEARVGYGATVVDLARWQRH